MKRKVVCSECQRVKHFEMLNKKEATWDKHKGDQDLWNKYSHITEIDSEDSETEPLLIIAIYRYSGGININTDHCNWISMKPHSRKKNVYIPSWGTTTTSIRLIERIKYE